MRKIENVRKRTVKAVLVGIEIFSGKLERNVVIKPLTYTSLIIFTGN